MITMTENDLTTEVELLKRDVGNVNVIHGRLDTAIEKLTEVSNCINRMLAVHEERLGQQEESQHRAAQEFTSDIKELHSRITTNTKELLATSTQQHKEHTEAIQKLRDDIARRVGVLEKWRWIIIGGSIVFGFVIQKLPIWS
jgi:DNA anti-recombination protein RmuC